MHAGYIKQKEKDQIIEDTIILYFCFVCSGEGWLILSI